VGDSQSGRRRDGLRRLAPARAPAGLASVSLRPAASGKNQTDGAGRRKARTSFLKKGSKKLFHAVASPLTNAERKTKVFWFFFSKKNVLSELACSAAPSNADSFI
jgi:hypothetical protein